MQRYAYKAKSRPFQTIQGFIDAETEQEAFNRLDQMGYHPVSIKAAEFSLRKHKFLRLRAVSSRELALFTINLSNLISSGVNLLKALNLITSQTTNKFLRSTLQDVTRKVKDGKPLSEAMAEHPRVFSSLYIALVRLAETGGSMEQTLKRLSDFLEKEQEFRGAVAAALMYPLFIFCVSVLTVAMLVGFVVPRLSAMFEDIGQVLPLSTRILLGTSGFFRDYWWLMALSVLVLGLALRRACRSEAARLYLDRFRLRLFFFGEVALKTEISRFTRTFSLLISGGIPILQSLDISRGVLGNTVLNREISRCAEQVGKGASLSGCLRESEWFSGFTADIIAIGEETGTLENALKRIAEDCEKQSDQSLKAFSKMIEPVTILFMGVVVGFIVLSMLLPVFQINLAVR